MPYALGVDLGTTYTAAAIAGPGRHVEIVPLNHTPMHIPSAAYRPSSGPIVYGDAAARHRSSDPGRTRTEFKQDIGAGDLRLGGIPVSATELTRGLLKSVLDKTVDHEGEPPARLTVTYPASWTAFRRTQMTRVITADWAPQADLITEPEAAGIHFASTGRMRVDDVVAVYDLGGGTFDASILRRTERGFELLGQAAGDPTIGGFAFDSSLRGLALLGLGWDPLDPDMLDEMSEPDQLQLNRDCHEAREALSNEQEVTVAGPRRDGGRGTIKVTRHDLEGLIRDDLEATVDTLTRTVAGAGLRVEELASVVLVGGTASTPLVRELVDRHIGVPVVLSPQPKFCVAMGAALSGAAGLKPLPPAIPAPATPAASPLTPQGPTRAASSIEPAPAEPTRTSRAQRSRHEAVKTARPGAPPWQCLAALVLLALVAMLTVLVNESPTGNPSISYLSGTSGIHAIPVTKPSGFKRSDTLTLTPTLFGSDLRSGASNGKTFDLAASRIFLAGPLHATVTWKRGNREQKTTMVDLRPSRGYPLSQRLLTVPGGLTLLALLFSAAYIESLLRSVIGTRRRPEASEVLALAGTGVVLGLAVVAVAWILGRRFIDPPVAIAIAACCSAAVGLLSFGWQRRNA